MTKTLLKTNQAVSQQGNPMKLQYYLLSDYNGELEQYGTEIVLQCGDREECSDCRNVTPLASSMAHLIGILASNLVTPALLHEILQDLI